MISQNIMGCLDQQYVVQRLSCRLDQYLWIRHAQGLPSIGEIIILSIVLYVSLLAFDVPARTISFFDRFRITRPLAVSARWQQKKLYELSERIRRFWK